MNEFREHYTPKNIAPRLCMSDMIMIWLSGFAGGVVLTLIATGK